jgi:hypothetical protein
MTTTNLLKIDLLDSFDWFVFFRIKYTSKEKF